MNRGIRNLLKRASLASLIRLVFGIVAAPVAAHAAPPAPLLGAELFTNGSVLPIAIELSPANRESLRKEPRRAVLATVRAGGSVSTNVGIHLKGALGSFSSVDDKPGLVLHYAKFIPGQRFHGLRKILLNNSVQDPSYLNERLAGELFRAAGVPAPRTSHAMVTLDGQPLGLYVLKEGFCKDYLRIHFGKASGNLYDINQGFYDLGDGSDLKQRFRLDSGAAPLFANLAELIAACQEMDAVRRWSKLDAILDVDRFVSFMAMEIITCHVDGYSTYGHNFRVYNNPANRKLMFIPNDMDRMFQQPRPSLLKPGFSALASAAVFETPAGRQKYAERCAWLSTNVFNLEKLTNLVSEVSAGVRPALAAWNPDAARNFDAQARLVCERLRRRADAIRQEFPPTPVQVPAANGAPGRKP